MLEPHWGSTMSPLGLGTDKQKRENIEIVRYGQEAGIQKNKKRKTNTDRQIKSKCGQVRARGEREKREDRNEREM